MSNIQALQKIYDVLHPKTPTAYNLIQKAAMIDEIATQALADYHKSPEFEKFDLMNYVPGVQSSDSTSLASHSSAPTSLLDKYPHKIIPENTWKDRNLIVKRDRFFRESDVVKMITEAVAGSQTNRSRKQKANNQI